ALCTLDTGLWLLSPMTPPFPPWLSALSIARDWLLLAALAVGVHVVGLLFTRGPTPAPHWVGASYGAAGLVALASVLLFDAVPAWSQEQRLRFYIGLQQLYVVGAAAFVIHRAIRSVRPGTWWRGEGDLIAGRTSRADALLYSLAGVGVAAWLPVILSRP